MNNYEDWAHLVAKKLKGEADVITAIEKEELDDAAAADAFVRTVLKPFLPENFGVGSGRIIDAFGNRTDYLDVIVYNRNFPRIGLRGTQSDYLYESVLAAFSIRAKYIRKSFFDSMDACASLARLETNTDKTALINLAKRNGLKPGPNKSFVHPDPLRTARFDLIGRPPAFMFAFTGVQGSLRLLRENLELWIEHRQQEMLDTPMRAFPAVIATQGCFAWRNAAPLALSNREMLGIGNDDAPIRLIVLQLLHLLNRRLNVTSDGYGLKPSLSTYLSQFRPPKFDAGVGAVDELVSLRISKKTRAEAARPQEPESRPQEPEPARDHSQKTAARPEAKPVSEGAAAATAAAAAAAQPTAEPAQPKPAPAEVSGGVFDKPSPFASKPAPEKAQAAKPEPTPSRPPAPSLGSTPIPSSQKDEMETPPAASPRPPVAPLGSAPIPQAEPAPGKPADQVIPPKPPVDIELTGENVLPGNTGASKEPDFDATVVIKPDASLSRKPEPENSTEAFIARVKEQLSNPEPLAENDEDPFSSTIPQ